MFRRCVVRQMRIERKEREGETLAEGEKREREKKEGLHSVGFQIGSSDV